jgi:hypothetical protein
LCSHNLFAERNNFGLGAFLLPVRRETIFIATRTTAAFLGYNLFSCKLLTQTNNFGYGTVLSLCVVSELQKKSSPELEHGTGFGDFGHYFCNLIFEANRFYLGAILLLCLVSELQEPLSLELELRTLFF